MSIRRFMSSLLFPFLLMMVPRYLVFPTHLITSSLSLTSTNSIFSSYYPSNCLFLRFVLRRIFCSLTLIVSNFVQYFLCFASLLLLSNVSSQFSHYFCLAFATSCLIIPSVHRLAFISVIRLHQPPFLGEMNSTPPSSLALRASFLHRLHFVSSHLVSLGS